jgi:hypothetical protein
MHFPPNPPSVDPGASAFLWSVVFGVFVWIGLRAIDVPQGTAVVFGALTIGVTFLLIRRYGAGSRRRSG